jgi:flagellar hook-basal body complex protein FliE
MENTALSQTSFITPMKLWNVDGATGTATQATGSVSVPFQDVFHQAIENVNTTQAEVEKDQYLLATGQLEDPHTLPIAESKAQISLDLLISLRNKAVESYNDLLKMSL